MAKFTIISDRPTINCYSADTEVLTDAGWAFFGDLTERDRFATLNREGVIEYQAPTHLINQPYGGSMYHLSGPNIELLTTPNHKLYVQRRPSRGAAWRPPEFVEAQDVFGTEKRFKKSGIWEGVRQEFFELQPVTIRVGRGLQALSGETRRIPMDDWLRFLGNYIAEGSCTFNEANYTVQIRQSKERNYNVMEEAFRKVTPFKAWGNGSRLLVRDKQLYEYLKTGVGSSHEYTRKIPREFLSLCKEQLRLLWDSILMGDGHVDKKYPERQRIFTSSPQLRDDLQELALKMGLAADWNIFHEKGKTLRIPKDDRHIVAKHDHYAVSVQNRHLRPIFSPKQTRWTEEWVSYSGRVYCAVVPNHLLYVRRNGKASWQSNTGYGVAALGLGKYLSKMGHDVSYIGLQAIGFPTYIKFDGKDIPIYSGSNMSEIDKAFKDLTPDLGIHCRDPFAFTPRFFPGAYSFRTLRSRPKMALWAPVQADMLPQDFVDACINEAEICVTFTAWGKETLMFQGVPFNKLESVHLGYDPETFKPVSQAEKLRWREKMGLSATKPVIGSVGINDQYRKGWPLLVKALSIVMKKMDVDAYFHCPPDGSFLLPHFQRMYGIPGKIAYPVTYDKTWGFSPEEMNKVENCFDVYASTSIEEGFSVPLAENLSIGNSVVATDMPVYREVLGTFGYYPTTYKLYPAQWTMSWLADPQSVANQIMLAIKERAEPGSEERQKKQLEFAKRYSWESIAKQWIALIKKHTELKVPV